MRDLLLLLPWLLLLLHLSWQLSGKQQSSGNGKNYARRGCGGSSCGTSAASAFPLVGYVGRLRSIIYTDPSCLLEIKVLWILFFRRPISCRIFGVAFSFFWETENNSMCGRLWRDRRECLCSCSLVLVLIYWDTSNSTFSLFVTSCNQWHSIKDAFMASL